MFVIHEKKFLLDEMRNEQINCEGLPLVCSKHINQTTKNILFQIRQIQAAEVSRRSLIINLQQLSCPIFGPLQPKERLLLPLSMAWVYFMGLFFCWLFIEVWLSDTFSGSSQRITLSSTEPASWLRASSVSSKLSNWFSSTELVVDFAHLLCFLLLKHFSVSNDRKNQLYSVEPSLFLKN